MWSPEQYEKFKLERNRPALDLIGNIPDLSYHSMIDLGCGNGEITQMVKERFNIANAIGMDSSESMLEKAKMNKGITWEFGSISDSLHGQYDLVFSNAALQWVGKHDILFKQLAQCTNKVLAVQMPKNFAEPSHVLLRETILENPHFSSKLKHTIRQDPVLDGAYYYDILKHDFSNINIWEATYLQMLSGENAVLEWGKGTALVPIRENLNEDEFTHFCEIYNKKLLQAYPPQDNVTLFPFQRIFIIANK